MDITREAVGDVGLVPKPLARGRVVIAFTDGSLIAFNYGTWRTGVARRMIAAINHWRMEDAGG